MAGQVQRHRDAVSEGASAAVLLLLMLLSIAASVTAANWADGLGILSWAAIGGLALGILVAKLPLRGWIAHPLMLIAGVPAIALFTSSLLPDVLTLQEKFIVLSERFWVWISKATLGGVSSDNLMFVVQVAYFTWMIAYLAAWFVYRRHQVWGAIIPTGIALLFNLFYALPQPGLYFTLYILCALLLVVRMNLVSLERWWRSAAVGYAGDISFDLLGYGLTFSILLMVLAWVVPASAPGPAWLGFLDPLQQPWQETEDQFNRVFGSLRAVGRPAPSTFFGTSLMMGGPVNLGQRPVMDIQTSAGRYWRATVYDKYSGIGWISTHASTLNLAANDGRLNVSPGALRVEVTQTYKVFLPDQNILYAESQPIRFDVPTEIHYAESPAQDPDAIFDLALTRSRRPLRDDDTYTVTSAISVADEESLRQASTAYGPWISQTYLQLPEQVPARVRALAIQLTENYHNPYDKARAIEQFLRKHIKYNDQVAAPPQGRDGVDYTLFDRPEGYCNYYASAMAVLARTIGIPARIASGYSLGEYQNGAFHVVEANAHSWVEVYFPGYGWIEFEPTSSKPDIDRPKKADPALEEQERILRQLEASRLRFANKDLEDPMDSRTSSPRSPLALFWNEPRNVALAGLSVLALLTAGTLVFLRQRRSHEENRLAPAARAYRRLFDRASWLGIGEHKHATPYERARVLGDALPQVRGEIDQATELYVRETFAARPLNESESTTLATLWARVRAELWRGAVLRILRQLAKRPREFVTDLRRSLDRWGHG